MDVIVPPESRREMFAYQCSSPASHTAAAVLRMVRQGSSAGVQRPLSMVSRRLGGSQGLIAVPPSSRNNVLNTLPKEGRERP